MDFIKIINKRIKDRSLPKSYAIKELADGDKCPKDYMTVYVPQGLTLNQWDKLLKKTSNGLWHSSEYSDFKGKGWRTEVFYAGLKPMKTNVTHAEGQSEGEYISPETYLALQWNRLELGLEPVDSETWSWLKDDDSFDGGGDAPFGLFVPDGGQVYLDLLGAGYRIDFLGVRPSVRGKNLEPLSSLDSSSLDKNTEAIQDLNNTLKKIFNVL